MSKISTGTYKNVKAVVMENDIIRMAILPEFGSKIASILYKPLNYETLWQNPCEEYIKTDYGDLYSEGEFSGFDEMFPSINRCFYEDTPWAGTEIPDHGEVWSVPWDYNLEKDYVALSVEGRRFPYRLEKKVTLEDGKIRIEYKATNLSDSDFDFIWAAHPLFNASKDMELIVPAEMDKIVNAYPGKRLNQYGKVYDFPVAQLDNGRKFNLSLVPEKNDDSYQKYYFLGKVADGWCSLYDKEKKLNIIISFPKEKVPYLGVWLNEGGWARQYNIAPEPATAAMDRIDFAKMWGMNSVLKANQTCQWYLDITIEEK